MWSCVVSFLQVFHNYLRVGYGALPYSFVMSKHREQSLKNRADILKKCYPLVATASWDSISVSDLEKAISKTRGALAYYFKNKKTLLKNIFDELFFPVFTLSVEEKETFAKSSVSEFYRLYKTPFERVRDDLRDNYGVTNPSQAIFNLFIQGSKHYEQFTTSIHEIMRLEQEFINDIVGERVNTLIDLNRIYVENIGNIFIESMAIQSQNS